MNQSTPWNSYALIVHLARQVGGKNLGKTKIQKLVYFLLAVKNIPVSYAYRFYTYGPYCDELAGDVDYLAAIGCLNVSPGPAGMGYTIEAGEQADRLEKKALSFIQQNQEAISEIVEKFGQKNARELELLATLVYLTRHEKDCQASFDNLQRRVLELKPRFRAEEVDLAYNELMNSGYLQ